MAGINNTLGGFQTTTPSTIQKKPTAGVLDLSSFGVGAPQRTSVGSVSGYNSRTGSNLPAATPPATSNVANANTGPTTFNANTGGGGLVGTQPPATQPVFSQSGGAIIPQGGNQPVQNPQQSQTQQPVKGLFPSVASSLATFDPFKNEVVSDAYAKAQELNKALAESKRNEAAGTATIMRQAIPLGDTQGQARVLQDQYLKQQQALASEFQGQSALYGAGFTGTQQQLSGLGTAGGLAQPSPASYGQTVFDPVTGQYTGGGGNLDPQTQASSLAQQVMSGKMTYDQALSSIGYAGQAGTNFLNNAITSAGGNPLQLQASGAAQQSNIGQQQTAQTDIARQGLQQATNDYLQMTGAAQFANQQSGAVSQILSQAGLNNTSSTDYNKVLNELSARFGDTNFAALKTALIEARSAYANLLSTGGQTPTGNEAQALATLDISQPASSINASIQQLENAVARRLQAQNSIRTQYEQNLGSGGSNYTAPSSGNSGADLTWDNI